MNAPRATFCALLVAPLLCCAPTHLLACACCSDEGQHHLDEGKPTDGQLAEMHYVKFAPTAQPYVGPGDLLDVKGVDAPTMQYAVEASFNEKNEWQLLFRDENGKSGTIWLPLAGTRVTAMRVDIHDGAKSAGGGPLLYKEWKFEGRPRGDGIFRTGLSAPARFKLIFQGRGNNCDSATDFSHWHLDVRGKKADFTFVGKIGDAAPATGEDEQTGEPEPG
jgi:hypothetical protein